MSVTPTPAVARLGEIVGSTHFSTNPGELARHAVDGLQPAAVARPGSAEEVAEVVRFAATENLAVIPSGARTKLRIGAPPHRYDLALDLTRLNRVLAYDPGDLTVGIEAGIRLAELSSVLSQHKQFLPLAVPFSNQATVGGTIASGVDSPLRQFYGTARDFVLGMEFITGEGARAKSGGRVVKNVTGYDLHKLLIGSLGTLAVITRVNFRTFPLPPMSRGFLAAFPSAEGALELRRRVAQSALTPVTLEILSAQTAAIFARATPRTLETTPLPGPWFSPSSWWVAVGFGGKESVIRRHASDLARMAKEARATSALVLGDEERPAVWGRLREFVALMLDCSPAATLLKARVLPAQLGVLMVRAQEIAAQHELPCALLARGVGATYVALLPLALDPQTLERLARAARQLTEFSASREIGGHAVIEWCPTELKHKLNVWSATREDFPLMQKVKKVFDPQGILSPGRFVGGI
jgi:glycolate oxidase FAD binding subunit